MGRLTDAKIDSLQNYYGLAMTAGATDTHFKHKHGLPESVLELVEPIYDALSTPELLGKCYQGKTQNNNECLNKLIRVPLQ